MKVFIVLRQDIDLKKFSLENSYLIGVERGCLGLINQDIPFDLAIGDFDSISAEEYEFIANKAPKLVKLNPVKDNTDTFMALQQAYLISDDITILGGVEGSRIEHFYANICLLKTYPNLKIFDKNSWIYSLKNQTQVINDFNYKFISFFALENSIISLTNFKYELDCYSLVPFDPLCISNEVLKNARVTVEGQVIVICSNEELNG